MPKSELWLKGCPVGESRPSFQKRRVVVLKMINKPQRIEMLREQGDSLLHLANVGFAGHTRGGISREAKANVYALVHRMEQVLSLSMWEVFSSVDIQRPSLRLYAPSKKDKTKAMLSAWLADKFYKLEWKNQRKNQS